MVDFEECWIGLVGFFRSSLNGRGGGALISQVVGIFFLGLAESPGEALAAARAATVCRCGCVVGGVSAWAFVGGVAPHGQGDRVAGELRDRGRLCLSVSLAYARARAGPEHSRRCTHPDAKMKVRRRARRSWRRCGGAAS